MSDLVERCRRYAKIIQGITVVPNDWQPGDDHLEIQEPRTTLNEAADEIERLTRAQPQAGEAVAWRWKWKGQVDDYWRHSAIHPGEDAAIVEPLFARPTPSETERDQVQAHSQAEIFFRLLEDECWTLKCESYPNMDDADVGWEVIEYHMAAPKERIVATGSTPLKAMMAAAEAHPLYTSRAVNTLRGSQPEPSVCGQTRGEIVDPDFVESEEVKSKGTPDKGYPDYFYTRCRCGGTTADNCTCVW